MKDDNRTAFQRADAVVVKIFQTISYLALFFLIAIMLIAFFNVCFEYLAKLGLPLKSIPQYSDWISYLHIPLVFLTAGFVTVDTGHTSIDILTSHYPKIVSRILAILGHLLCMAVCLLLLWRGFTKVLSEQIQFHTTIASGSSTAFPEWPFGVTYCVGLVLLVLSFAWGIVRELNGYEPPRPEEERPEDDKGKGLL